MHKLSKQSNYLNCLRGSSLKAMQYIITKMSILSNLIQIKGIFFSFSFLQILSLNPKSRIALWVLSTKTRNKTTVKTINKYQV